MGYGIWGRNARGAKQPAFSDKAYERAALAPWDEKWHQLSVEARRGFLDHVKGPGRENSPRTQQAGVSADKFAPAALKELVDGGFVAVEDGRRKSSGQRVFAEHAVFDFAVRVRALRRYHLLDKDQGEFKKFISYTSFTDQLLDVISRVTHEVEIDDFLYLDELSDLYLTSPQWADWVASYLKKPVYRGVLNAILAADGPVPLAGLAERVKGFRPEEARSALDDLVAHLALVEDLSPDTLEIQVGFLPAVREALEKAKRPRVRPPLEPVVPDELGPEGGLFVNDLRAFLLEITSERPRLRQDLELFQKEAERFHEQLEPVPPWFLETLRWDRDYRLGRTLDSARLLGLAQEVEEDGQARLQVTAQGKRWLTARLDEQYKTLYDLMVAPPEPNELYRPNAGWLYAGMDPYTLYDVGDSRFYGIQLAVMKVKAGGRRPYYSDCKPADRVALKDAVYRSLSGLEPGVFYAFEDVVAHVTYGEFNPLSLGLPPEKVAVFFGARFVQPLPDVREDAGRALIESFTRRRLIPLGCFRTALDKRHRLLVARQPLLDAYFGRAPVASGIAEAAKAGGRVVVQPDFSVIVIGLSTAPVADLAPFCERAGAGGTQGAKILKITRESVVKAVSQGLQPAEIITRLERHAGKTVPPNVLREIREWGGWVRRVTATTVSVLRCPDRETADRVMGVLRKAAERLGDTIVAVDPKTLTESERTRLRAQGVLVEKVGRPQPEKKKKKAGWR